MRNPAINSIKTHLARHDLEDRVEMARVIKDMLDHPGWEVFSKLLTDRIDTQRFVIEGHEGIREHAEMTSQAGNLRGLLFAASITKGVIESGDEAQAKIEQTVRLQEAA